MTDWVKLAVSCTDDPRFLFFWKYVLNFGGKDTSEDLTTNIPSDDGFQRQEPIREQLPSHMTEKAELDIKILKNTELRQR